MTSGDDERRSRCGRMMYLAHEVGWSQEKCRSKSRQDSRLDGGNWRTGARADGQRAEDGPGNVSCDVSGVGRFFACPEHRTVRMCWRRVDVLLVMSRGWILTVLQSRVMISYDLVTTGFIGAVQRLHHRLATGGRQKGTGCALWVYPGRVIDTRGASHFRREILYTACIGMGRARDDVCGTDPPLNNNTFTILSTYMTFNPTTIPPSAQTRRYMCGYPRQNLLSA